MEQLSNFQATTTLNMPGGLDATTTTLTLTSTTPFPSSYPFRIGIDDELMKVTANAGTNQWTVVRGDGGTTATSHLNSASVIAVLTKEALDAILSIQSSGTEVATRRVLNFSGVTVDDDPTNSRVNLTVNWAGYGPIFPITAPPLAATWTTVNFGTGDALTDTTTGLNLSVTRHASDWFRLATIASGSPPYTITAAMLSLYPLTSAARINLCLRNSTSSKIIVFGPIYTTSDHQLFVTQMNSPTSFNSHALQSNFGILAPMLFLRINDDGTTRSYQVSADNVTYSTVYSEATGTWITPDQVGWGVDAPSGGPFVSTLIHWTKA